MPEARNGREARALREATGEAPGAATSWHWSLDIAPDELGRLEREGPMSLEDRLVAILGVAPGESLHGWAAHAMSSVVSMAERAVAAVHAEDLLRRVAADLVIERVDVVEAHAERFIVDVRLGGQTLRIGVPRREFDATRGGGTT